MRRRQLPVADLSNPPSVWPRGKRAVLLVPGEDAVVFDLEMPAGVRRGVADRIMFHSVQDVVGEEMAEIHLVRLPPERGATSDRRQAIVTCRVRMSTWLEQAFRMGMRLAAVLPDYLALPWESGVWTVRVESGRLRARFGRLEGFAAETDLGVAILKRRWKDAPAAPERIRLLVEPATPEEASTEVYSWMDDLGIPVGRETPSAATPHFEHGELDANLIVGAFSESVTLMQELARWRRPLAFATAALIAWALDTGLTLRHEQAEIERLEHQIEEIFRAEFVPVGPVVNLRVQAARSLEALRIRSATSRDENSFLALLAASGEPLAAGAQRISRLSYREDVLTAEVTLADFRALEALDAELEKRQVVMEVESSTASAAQGVDAALNLRRRDAI